MPEAPARSAAVQTIGRVLNRVATRWSTPGAGRVVVCAPLVGVIAGLGAVAFLVSLDWTIQNVLGRFIHFQMPPTGEGVRHAISYPFPWWGVVLIPTIGGLLSGLLVFTFAPEAEGHGTDALIRAFHRGGGQIRARVPLIKDLKQRGLLDDTLVIWGGEFGRTPFIQGNFDDRARWGRDHHPYAFTTWLAGGGVKAGLTYGASDELAMNAVEHPVHVHDFQATVLHLLGIDHKRLTYRFQGRDFRLTDVHGEVVKDILA